MADLLFELAPASVQTAESVRWCQSSEPVRARRRSWVARDQGNLVGYASAYFQWYGGEAGKGRIEVWVRPERRRRGIGTELWEIAAAHVAGAKKLTVEVDEDPDGLRFVERRGFTQYDSEVISELDPRAANVGPTPHPKLRVVTLAEIPGRDRELFEFFGAAGGLRPGDPENRVAFHEWHRFILGNPLLDPDGSFVVLDVGDRVVSLAWLLVDLTRRRAENEWTATLPELRRQGLARLAKLAAIRWAAKRGLTELWTGNDPDNAPMRELNRRLGYRELFVRRDLERRA